MYFCLSCAVGKEDSVKMLAQKFLSAFTDLPFKVWFPMKQRTERRRGHIETAMHPLFPGYLFIYWPGDEEKEFPFRDIRRIPDARIFLRYDDGSAALKGNDLKFASWIHAQEGVITQSTVELKEGEKIHIVKGPLTGFDGHVVKVDKHHKEISVQFDFAGICNTVKFSVEFINQNQAAQKLHDYIS